MGNIHLVTGYAGKQHVTSADQGVFHTAIFGDGQFVFDRGNKLAASVVTNNLIRITDGDIYMQGRHIRLNEDAYVDLAIENGAQGMLRNDLIVARYTKDAVTGVEDVNLVVIKGTATNSNPVDPAYTEGDIITGHALLNDMPIYRIPLTGLNVGTPVALFEVQSGILENVEDLAENKQERTESLTTTTVLADADYFPFYDTSAKAHRKTTWSNIKTVLSNIFAAKSHVAQHKTGGADAIAPEDIGAGRVNPNLLDNWYFGNPVNQRGQMEYKTNGYTVDRWKSSASTNTVKVVDGCIDFTVATSGQSVQQPQTHWEDLKGKTVTASMLLAAGATARICIVITGGTTVRSEYISSGIASVTGFIPADATNVYIAVQSDSVGSAVKLIAAKLELGTQQTLAHQGADGNWLLNEIPDYNEQFLRCCMSTADSADDYANNKLTAAAVNAVPLDGSKAMTGNLNITSATNKHVDILNSTTSRSARMQVNAEYAQFNNMSNNNNYTAVVLAKETETLQNVLRLRFNTTEKGAVFYPILHTGNVPKPCNFVLGEYVGTGTKGSDGKCSITFPFVPKYVVIGAVPGGTGTEFTFINPDTTMAVNKDTFGTFVDFHCSWTDKTLTWWLGGTGNYGAGDQLNAEGTTYRYIAWGEAL